MSVGKLAGRDINGKGRTDPAKGRLASTKAPPVPPKPREARKLAPGRIYQMNEAVKATLTRFSSDGNLPPGPIAISLTRARVWLKEVGADGKLTFQLVGGDQTADFERNDLKPLDYATLALLIPQVIPKSGDAQALAGVYMESIGKMDEADKYYDKAGEASAGNLQKLFD